MKKLITLILISITLTSCAGLNKAAGYSKGTLENTDWKINKL